MDSVLVPAAAVSTVVAVVGYLLKRAIDGVDKSVNGLSAKVEALTAKDGQHSESIVELRVRVASLERELLQLQRSVQRRRSTDTEGA